MSAQPPRKELESHEDEPRDDTPPKEAYEAPSVESVKLTPEAAESLT